MDRQLHDRIRMLSFFMTCVIVVYHFGSVGNEAIWLDRMLINGLEPLAILAMGHFFGVTGFLHFRGLSMKNYGAKLKRRVFSLLVPYLLWQLLIGLVQLATGTLPASGELFKNLFLLGTWPPDGALWYLYAVFLLAVLSPLLLACFRGRRVGAVAMVVLAFGAWWACVTGNHLVQPIARYGYMRNVLTYLPAYFVGAYFGHFYDSGAGPAQLSWLLPIPVIAVLLERTYRNSVMMGVTAMLPMLLIFLCPVPEKLRERKIYDLSFLLYAIHQPLIEPVYGLTKGLFQSVPGIPGLMCLGSWAFALALYIGIAALLYFVLKRLAPRLLKLLTGGRAG